MEVNGAGWRLKWAGWRWVEVDGTGWRWVHGLVIPVFKQSSYSLAFTIFPQKKSLSSFPENTLNSIATSKCFTYEWIKGYGFANMVCFIPELNQFCLFKLRYRNNKTYFWLPLLLSGDISLNGGPVNGSKQYNNDQWTVFKKRGLKVGLSRLRKFLPNFSPALFEKTVVMFVWCLKLKINKILNLFS